MDKNVVKLNSIKDLGDPFRVQESSGEYRYNCPYCIEKRGKADDDGKLFVNTEKGVGFCFKCETKIILNNKNEISVVGRELLEKKIIDEKKESCLDMSFELATNKEWALSYFESRGINETTVAKLGIRCTEVPYNAVIFCNKVDEYNKCNFYQMRAVDKEVHKTWRFYTPKGVTIPPCWTHVNPEADTIFICEGFGSGASLFQESNYESGLIVLCGKSLTSFQKKGIVDYIDKKRREIIVAIDGGFDNEIQKVLDFLIKGGMLRREHKISVMRMPEDKDPNDLLLEGSLSNFINKREVMYE